MGCYSKYIFSLVLVLLNALCYAQEFHDREVPDRIQKLVMTDYGTDTSDSHQALVIEYDQQKRIVSETVFNRAENGHLMGHSDQYCYNDQGKMIYQQRYFITIVGGQKADTTWADHIHFVYAGDRMVKKTDTSFSMKDPQWPDVIVDSIFYTKPGVPLVETRKAWSMKRNEKINITTKWKVGSAGGIYTATSFDYKQKRKYNEKALLLEETEFDEQGRKQGERFITYHENGRVKSRTVRIYEYSDKDTDLIIRNYNYNENGWPESDIGDGTISPTYKVHQVDYVYTMDKGLVKEISYKVHTGTGYGKSRTRVDYVFYE